MKHPQVTIIVVPRERFQFTQKSLESLYENTQHPFHLIYVDNNSPDHVREYLEDQSQQKAFEWVRSPYYLSPNQARNVGLRRVKTPFVVFVDNDIIFAPGWLTALMQCERETGAAVIGSLVCQYEPIHTIVHCIGGDYMEPTEYASFSRGERGPKSTIDQAGQWTIEEKTYFQNQPIAEVKDQLQRQTVGFIEFHAMLVRTSLFNRIGLLDEGFSCTKEYLDFCMTVTRLGEPIYLEPTSVVTFLTHPPAPTMELSDLPYFMLRWSDEWELASLKHFQKKWNLAESRYFQKRYKKLGQRRRKELIKPLVSQFSFLNEPAKKWLEKRLVGVEKLFNRYLSKQYRTFLQHVDTAFLKESLETTFPDKTFPGKTFSGCDRAHSLSSRALSPNQLPARASNASP
ncbi:glycosyl transferase, group 2 family protein [Synechococcus sp. PCC 7335]|uniref:glycosyltransferase family 2 protein n=1 Tax=Synechococcus sp. (strain ATCC 29403 / PCC 7335) TaxID=91464 RepID=UPI00017EDFC9|nr:glycosyltransferase [Synechococcus sp. PCC 7335]EDX84019.1 glycosyl transferase, group 2 family protein [Synechococcus sp. PCC 7335]